MQLFSFILFLYILRLFTSLSFSLLSSRCLGVYDSTYPALGNKVHWVLASGLKDTCGAHPSQFLFHFIFFVRVCVYGIILCFVDCLIYYSWPIICFTMGKVLVYGSGEIQKKKMRETGELDQYHQKEFLDSH